MEETALLAGLRARDTAVIEVFWLEYFEKLYPICAYILGDGPDALDATVDILADFVEVHSLRLSKPEALYAYLRLMCIRRGLRLRERRQKTVTSHDVDLFPSDSGEERIVTMRLLMPILETCLETMTPKAQQALRLKYGKQISNERIGRYLGGSKQYIGRLIRDALKALRDCIERKETNSEASQRRGIS